MSILDRFRRDDGTEEWTVGNYGIVELHHDEEYIPYHDAGQPPWEPAARPQPITAPTHHCWTPHPSRLGDRTVPAGRNHVPSTLPSDPHAGDEEAPGAQAAAPSADDERTVRAPAPGDLTRDLGVAVALAVQVSERIRAATPDGYQEHLAGIGYSDDVGSFTANCEVA